MIPSLEFLPKLPKKYDGQDDGQGESEPNRMRAAEQKHKEARYH